VDQSHARNDPISRLRSDDADIVRTSRRQHSVEDMDRHANFTYMTFVYTGAQAVTHPLFPSSDRRLDLSTPVVAGGLLPRQAAALGDALEVTRSVGAVAALSLSTAVLRGGTITAVSG
jgi:hypothetical protein